MGPRQRVEPTDDWQQLQLLTPFPEQRSKPRHDWGYTFRS